MDKINKFKPTKRPRVFSTAGKTISSFQATQQLSALKDNGLETVGIYSTISPIEELSIRDAFQGSQKDADIALLLRDKNNLEGKKKPTVEEAFKTSEDYLERRRPPPT